MPPSIGLRASPVKETNQEAFENRERSELVNSQLTSSERSAVFKLTHYHPHGLWATQIEPWYRLIRDSSVARDLMLGIKRSASILTAFLSAWAPIAYAQN